MKIAFENVATIVTNADQRAFVNLFDTKTKHCDYMEALEEILCDLPPDLETKFAEMLVASLEHNPLWRQELFSTQYVVVDNLDFEGYYGARVLHLTQNLHILDNVKLEQSCFGYKYGLPELADYDADMAQNVFHLVRSQVQHPRDPGELAARYNEFFEVLSINALKTVVAAVGNEWTPCLVGAALGSMDTTIPEVACANPALLTWVRDHNFFNLDERHSCAFLHSNRSQLVFSFELFEQLLLNQYFVSVGEQQQMWGCCALVQIGDMSGDDYTRVIQSLDLLDDKAGALHELVNMVKSRTRSLTKNPSQTMYDQDFKTYCYHLFNSLDIDTAKTVAASQLPLFDEFSVRSIPTIAIAQQHNTLSAVACSDTGARRRKL